MKNQASSVAVSRNRLSRRSVSRNMVFLDLIPMIDIVFQLILFFLVSTTFALLPGITVQLPESSTAEGGETRGLIITLSADGGIWFNDKAVTLEELHQELLAFDTESVPREQYPIQLEADALVTNGTIVQLFDLLRKNGFSAVNLRTVQE
ncbi:MAG: biopolymer transporter ExbD [Treponema sp.]|nr:biopolymer transporter ExbD [Spirochaetia bacterium]MDD7274968.1 biopolymer transporter ExbD [Treponema sp.]MDY3755592.1 biopolymer transporter ExbD [Treponema sp.]MDY4675044.1 biopolymer transporter ExbD [Treponema sp.]